MILGHCHTLKVNFQIDAQDAFVFLVSCNLYSVTPATSEITLTDFNHSSQTLVLWLLEGHNYYLETTLIAFSYVAVVKAHKSGSSQRNGVALAVRKIALLEIGSAVVSLRLDVMVEATHDARV